MNKIKIALPAGSLKEKTLKILNNSGMLLSGTDRSYVLTQENTDGYEYMLVKSQEIGGFVERGLFDIGVVGMDWVAEYKSDVEIIKTFEYSKRAWRSVRLVLAVPEKSFIRAPKDLDGKTIATEFVEITKTYLEKNGIDAFVEFSWGATESKPFYSCDAIVDVVDTGNSLSANNLRVVEEIFVSPICIVANRNVFNEKGKTKPIDSFVEMFSQGYKKSALQ